MHIIEIENGYAIKIQYELKDLFKSNFPSAKWNREEKQWEIGNRSKNRLEQWMAQVEETNDALIESKKNREESDITESELVKIENELNDIKALINNEKLTMKNINEFNQKIDKTKKIVESKNKELKILQEKRAQEIQKLKSKLTDLKDKMVGIIDIDKCLDAQEIMIKNYKRVGSNAHEEYKNAQHLIKESIDSLKEANLKSVGLNKLFYMNFNRPDRDNPRSVTKAEFYVIELIKEE